MEGLIFGILRYIGYFCGTVISATHTAIVF